MNSFKTLASPRRTLVWSFGLTLLCALILWSAQVRAEVAAGVHFVGGLVTATAGGQSERELAKGGEIYDSDEVNTAYNGRVQMRFTDGGLVSLMPNTTFTVEEYRLGAGSGEDGALVFGLLRGGLRTVTGAIGKTKHDNYQLKTPVGTLGIRGTEFIVVIGPPGTLRVHVGRGKVVITNSYGSLEVPEGSNAVVTLGSAPMLSEEGPVFLAISPIGDSGAPLGMVRQDPYALELPLAGFAAAGGLPSGPGYVMTAGGVASGAANAVFDSSGTLVAFDDPGFSLSPADLGIAGASTNVGLGLSWGVFNDAAGDYGIGVNAITPYIIGQGVALPTSGSLSYRLAAGVTPAVYSSATGGAVGSLNQFDLVLGNLGSTPTYALSMDVGIGGVGGAFTTNSSGGLNVGGNGFSFQDFSVMGSACVMSSCNMDVAGFITGSGGAGASYAINNGNGDFYSGVAPLQSP